MVFDTGSSLLEVPSKPIPLRCSRSALTLPRFPGTSCTTCSHQHQFATSKSSTYKNGGRSQSLTFATGVGVTPVDGDNWQLRITSGTDTVSVGGVTVTNTAVNVITSQTPTFNPDPFDGIMGERHSLSFLVCWALNGN